MKILSIGLDGSAFDPESALAQRLLLYGSFVDAYTVVVPTDDFKEVRIAPNVIVYGIKATNKLFGMCRIFVFSYRLLQRESYNIITVQDQYFLGLLAYLLAKSCRIGLEIQVHGWEKTTNFRIVIARLILRHANVVRTVSERLKRQLIVEFGVKKKNIVKVPIFSSPPKTIIVRRNSSDKDSFIFLTVGRLVLVKNIRLQILTLAEIIRDHPNTILWIVGDGPELGALKKIVAYLKLEAHVIFFGFIRNKDMFNYYEKAQCFLLTSNQEGWGMVVVEAAYHHLPIIMTDVGCAGEFIINQNNGIIIPIGNKNALLQAMRSVISDAALRSRLGKAAAVSARQLPNEQATLLLYKQAWNKAKL